MNIEVGDKILVTLDNFFIAKDGKQYRAVFGTLHGIVDAESALGIKTNARSTNWYLKVGSMILAGCQIHFVERTDEINSGRVREGYLHEGKEVESMVNSKIYCAD